MEWRTESKRFARLIVAERRRKNCAGLRAWWPLLRRCIELVRLDLPIGRAMAPAGRRVIGPAPGVSIAPRDEPPSPRESQREPDSAGS